MKKLLSSLLFILLYSYVFADIFSSLNAKSQYSIMNPTPYEDWRPMSADRPDFTESPYTVDAGAFQLETSFIDYAENGSTETWTVAPVNFKIGLLNTVDLQFIVDLYIHKEDSGTEQNGNGDVQLRLKKNLWGNDGAISGFAFMPFIKIPVASDDLGNDHIEGGLIFPFATGLFDNFGLGLMFETDFVYDEIDNDYNLEFITTGVLGLDVTDAIGLYLEGIGITNSDSDVDFSSILGFGTTYKLTDNIIFDLGTNIGLSGGSDEFNIFSGSSIRF